MQIWGAKDVSANNLNAAKQAGHVILGFQEPDLASQADMSVQVGSFACVPFHGRADDYALVDHIYQHSCCKHSLIDCSSTLEATEAIAVWTVAYRRLLFNLAITCLGLLARGTV